MRSNAKSIACMPEHRLPICLCIGNAESQKGGHVRSISTIVSRLSAKLNACYAHAMASLRVHLQVALPATAGQELSKAAPFPCLPADGKIRLAILSPASNPRVGCPSKRGGTACELVCCAVWACRFSQVWQSVCMTLSLRQLDDTGMP